MSRLVRIVSLSVSTMVCGFALTLAVATELVYPGPPSVDLGLARLSLAIGGGFAGLTLGVLLGFRFTTRQAVAAAVTALLFSGAAFGFLAWRAANRRNPAANTLPIRERAARCL